MNAQVEQAQRCQEASSQHLTFLHLSDIHFRWPKHGKKYELDDDLRNELTRDARRKAEELGTPSAVLVTGDVAFSGAQDEYCLAAEWLKKDLLEATGCPGQNVCCIPGNHDVDWNTIRKSKAIRDCHKYLREEELHLLDSSIQEYLSDPFVFYRALDNYNMFAAEFDSDVSVTNPFWSRDFVLSDGSILRVRGANSALISDEQDDVRTGNLLVLGSHQCTMKNEDGVEHMFLCHHPSQWLLDGDQVETSIRRAKIQLFGHKHEQKLNVIDERLRIVAGAVHPDRRERNWRPRYNWFTLHVSGSSDARMFNIDVHPRVWSPDNQKFAADYDTCDGSDHKRYSVPISSWTPPARAASPTPSPPAQPASVTTADSEVETIPVDPARTLAHRFLGLTYVVRLEVAQALKLVKDEDEALPEPERSKRFFARAKEDRKLAELWNEVERRHGDGRYPTNPFANPTQ